MNGQHHWILNRFSGQIHSATISGSCNTLHPGDGISIDSIQMHAVADARFLAPSFPSVIAPASGLPETFVRSGDLAAIYAPTAEFPFRSQAYWRLQSHPSEVERRNVLAACELVASTQTDLLDSRPDITVSSILPAGRVYRLLDPVTAEFAELAMAGSIQTLTPADGTSCLVVRFVSLPYSYAELVFPFDFESTRLERSDVNGQRAVKTVHHLFAHPLEKGVVLRSRVLGLWMHSDADLETAAAHYRLFAQSDPPLTA